MCDRSCFHIVPNAASVALTIPLGVEPELGTGLLRSISSARLSGLGCGRHFARLEQVFLSVHKISPPPPATNVFGTFPHCRDRVLRDPSEENVRLSPRQSTLVFRLNKLFLSPSR